MTPELTDIKKYVCENCKYAWISRVAIPKQCPRCKVYDYDKKRDEPKQTTN